jgi:hypothetical protein
MATAEKKTISKPTVVVHDEEVVDLRLTMEEADALIAILGSIGGDPDTSPRKHFWDLSNALYDATGLRWADTESYSLAQGNIWFKERESD